MSSRRIFKELKKLGSAKKAKASSRFFKTGKGEYGEGDKFFGITVPEQRKIAKENVEISFTEISKLIKNPFHEARLTGLFILVYKYEKADYKLREKIYNFYIKNLSSVNNWDLVDTTTPNIVGHHLWENRKERKLLYKLAKSKNIWERRISILATFHFIRNNDFKDAIKIAEKLLEDKEDLIHKAVGWMLREIGKRDQKTMENFLKKYIEIMPRTTLRYAIERLPENKREYYMNL